MYPLVDGPGVALLVFLPPFLAIMALPVLDMMVHFRPGNALNPVALLILPFTLPLVVSVSLTIGYILIFLGRVIASSATGEDDHPRFPTWNRMEILDEMGRWIWAGLMGLAVGGLPAVVYWVNCGKIDWMDWFLFTDLAIIGAAYAQLGLMAALLHETLLAANPITIFRSITRLGWNYLGPCLVTGLCLVICLAAWTYVLQHSASVGLGMLGLWACWVFTLYVALVICRVLGTTYYKNADALGWFRTARF
ncbi:hypothetical protein P12x_003967 [Tundrisphaera lichenicola]|uniref:hypothetical protein n=1 Tax=Tundrisphaera lichenicola TaxID=2029860 RepID=UPI003EBC5F48